MLASLNTRLLVVLLTTLTYQVATHSCTTRNNYTQSTLPFLTLEIDRSISLSTPLFTLTSETQGITSTSNAPISSVPYPSPYIMATSPNQYVLPVTLTSEPRIHLKAWLKATNKYARSLSSTLDPYGALYLVCSDKDWEQLRFNVITSTSPNTIRTRPDFNPPPFPKLETSHPPDTNGRRTKPTLTFKQKQKQS